MQRFFGMMPSSEIEVSKTYDDGQGRTVGIDAGPHGWTVRWADSSCSFKDVDDTTEANLQKAIDCLKEKFPEAYEKEAQVMGEM